MRPHMSCSGLTSQTKLAGPFSSPSNTACCPCWRHHAVPGSAGGRPAPGHHGSPATTSCTQARRGCPSGSVASRCWRMRTWHATPENHWTSTIYPEGSPPPRPLSSPAQTPPRSGNCWRWLCPDCQSQSLRHPPGSDESSSSSGHTRRRLRSAPQRSTARRVHSFRGTGTRWWGAWGWGGSGVSCVAWPPWRCCWRCWGCRAERARPGCTDKSLHGTPAIVQPGRCLSNLTNLFGAQESHFTEHLQLYDQADVYQPWQTYLVHRKVTSFQLTCPPPPPPFWFCCCWGYGLQHNIGW